MAVVAGPTAGKLNLTIQQGATFSVQLTYKAGSDTASAAAVNLTGYTARLKIRPTWSSDTVHVSLTESDGIALGGSAGTITLSRTPAQTAAYTWRDGVYDLELETPLGVVRRVVEGKVLIVPEVTR